MTEPKKRTLNQAQRTIRGTEAEWKAFAAKCRAAKKKPLNVLGDFCLAYTADTPVTRDDLPKTMQERLDVALRQHKRALEAEFTERVKADSDKRLGEFLLPYWNGKITEAEDILASHKGVMTRAEYRKLLACLHTDRSMSDGALAEVFNKVKGLERVLCKTDVASPAPAFPKNFADMMTMRRGR